MIEKELDRLMAEHAKRMKEKGEKEEEEKAEETSDYIGKREMDRLQERLGKKGSM